MGAATPHARPVTWRAVAEVPKNQEVAAAFAPPDVDVEEDDEDGEDDELAGAASDDEEDEDDEEAVDSAFFAEESPLPFDFSAVPERESLR
jgi:hypothetical protein